MSASGIQIPNSLGFMEIDFEGVIRVSEDELANAETMAPHFAAIIQNAGRLSQDAGGPNRLGKFQRISLVYPDFTYHLSTAGQNKIFVVKVKSQHLEVPSVADSNENSGGIEEPSSNGAESNDSTNAH